MKTAEELFDKYSHKDNGGEYMYLSQFIKALAEYDAEIIKIIDEMMQEIEVYPYNQYNSGYKTALTELKQKIEEL